MNLLRLTLFYFFWRGEEDNVCPLLFPHFGLHFLSHHVLVAPIRSCHEVLTCNKNCLSRSLQWDNLLHSLPLWLFYSNLFIMRIMVSCQVDSSSYKCLLPKWKFYPKLPYFFLFIYFFLRNLNIVCHYKIY